MEYRVGVRDGMGRDGKDRRGEVFAIILIHCMKYILGMGMNLGVGGGGGVTIH